MKRALPLTAALLAAGLFVTACGDDADNSPAQSPSTSVMEEKMTEKMDDKMTDKSAEKMDGEKMTEKK